MQSSTRKWYTSIMINGMFQSIKAADLLNANNRKLAERVAGLWNRYVAPEADYMRRQSVILVDFGHWLDQKAWTDDHGFFLKVRLAPLDRNRKDVQDRGTAVANGFKTMFGDCEVYVDNPQAFETGSEETVTVVVKTGFNMIGD